MKKTYVIALLLSFCLILTSLCPVFAADDALETTETNADTVQIDSTTLTRAKTLEMIGILDTDAETFAAQPEVSRAEIAELAVKLAGYIDVLGGEDSAYFLDVEDDAKYKSAIGRAVMHGLMCGTEKYKFEPERPISYTEMLKVMLNVLGYGWMAEMNGGYPSGYVKIAAQTGLSRNARNSDALSGEAVVNMVYNALDVEVLVPTRFGDDISYESYEGRTLLTENLKLEMVKGVVTAIPKTELYGEALLNNDEIMIDGTRVVYESLYDDLLGMNVTAYCGTDDDADLRNAVYIEVMEENNVLEIDSEDVSYADNVFKYYDENGKSKRASTETGAAVIFNGKALSDPSLDMSKLSQHEGRVILIDNDDDGVYEVIKIYRHYNIRVQSIDTSRNTIFVKDGESLTANDIDKWYFFDKNGKPSALKSIPDDVVLSVEKSGDTITFYVGMDSISGTVEGVYNNKITINGVEYKLSKGMKVSEIPALGESGVFLRDRYGSIAFFDKGVGGFEPGVVVGVSLYGVIDTSLKIRLFNIMSEVVTYDVASNIKLDGKRVKLTDTLANGDNVITARLAEGAAKENTDFTSEVPYGQVIRYKLNSDKEIIEIDTAVQNQNETDDTLRMVTTARSSYYKRDGYNFGGHTVVDTNTIVFKIICPMSKPEEDIKLTSIGSFGDNITKKVESLSFTDEGITSDVLVVYELSGTGTISVNNGEMIVDEIGQTMNSDGEVVKTISGYYKGSYETYNLKDNAIIDSELSQGDLIRFDQNAKSELTLIRHIYCAANDSFATTFPYMRNEVFGGDQTNLGWDIDYRAAQGYIWHYHDDSLIFVPARTINDVSEAADKETFNMNGVNIYIYDKNDTRTPVYVGSKSDIGSYLKYGEDATKVYIRTYFSNVNTILVVR